MRKKVLSLLAILIMAITAQAGEITVTWATSDAAVATVGADTATITLTPASTIETLDGNQLQGTATSITNPGNAYVLNKTATNGVGFYKLSATATIGANKAYLMYSGPSLARGYFGFDETTGIEMPTAEVIDTDGVVFDLQGRRVAQPTKGLYIVNGKKVFINK